MASAVPLRIMVVLASAVFHGAAADRIGRETLRLVVPGLNGGGVVAGQVEAADPIWQVNPQVVGHPQSLFTWVGPSGSTNRFPNQIGEESGHANQVGLVFYGVFEGIATGLDRVINYEANHFYTLIQAQTVIDPPLVNQSFAFPGQIATVDRDYDDYAARYGTLFVNGIGNDGSPRSPATMYNGIGVAAFNGSSAVGPTSDGRSKPDVSAPFSMTSFAAPLVSGAAALLMEAAALGVGGPSTASDASDYRTLKALLLNGADKPAGWTNGPAIPLDARHGTGVLNVHRSYRQLRGGRHAANDTDTFSQGGAHLPGASANTLPARRGWDRNSLTSTRREAGAAHYRFAIGEPLPPNHFFQATLVWSRRQNQSGINNLDLFLYDSSRTLVASSESTVDNVEHLYVPGLAADTYVLQVLKQGGMSGRVSNGETYALAFEFGPHQPVVFAQYEVENNRFQTSVTAEPHEFYRFLFSGDGQTWSPFSTNQATVQGTIDLVDPAPGSIPDRLYRAILAP